jgi:hypothetical protein
VTGRLLTWQRIHDTADTLELQTFACTTAWPRTPGGRRVRAHPREWEWAAQSHLRNLNRLMRPGDPALVGRDPEHAVSAARRVHPLPAEVVPWVRLDVVRGLHQPTCQAAAVRIALTCASRQDTLDAVQILPSALKHGITEAEVRTALEVPMRHVWQGENLLLVIGADSTARLLEVVVADPETSDERVIHAMSLRPKFYRYL